MKLKQVQKMRGLLLLALIVGLTGLSNQIKADTGNCGGVTITLPFNDVMASPFFCQIAAAYFSGLTNGTGDGTTYSPTQTVTREQMAAFISRTMDQSLKRGSRRAVAKKWFTPQDVNSLTRTIVGDFPQQVEFDGTDLWVPNYNSGTVMRVSPGDGKVLETWTGAINAYGIACAMGKIFITGTTNPGSLYMIDPTQPAGAVTTLASNLGVFPNGIAFDGSRIWTANNSGSISIISLNPTSVTTISAGFLNPLGVLYDGASIWVADGGGTLLKLNSNGSIAQTINTGAGPKFIVFDGTNIWVPDSDSPSVTVVRVKDAGGNALVNAFVVATLTGNGLNTPVTAAFDGERILVTNLFGDGVSLWKAADLTPLGFFTTGAGSQPSGACSDGLNFWIALSGTDRLARF
jgi:hypothetical protein